MSQNNKQVMRMALLALEPGAMPHPEHESLTACAIAGLKKALTAQAEQSEPIALWRYKDTFSVLPAMNGYTSPGPDWGPLYTHPASVRKPLTPDKYVAALGPLRDEMICSASTLRKVVQAIEAAHGITLQGTNND